MDAGFWTRDILNTIEKKEDRLGYLIRVPEHTTAFKELVDIFREDLPKNIYQFILSHDIFGMSIKREIIFFMIQKLIVIPCFIYLKPPIEPVALFLSKTI